MTCSSGTGRKHLLSRWRLMVATAALAGAAVAGTFCVGGSAEAARPAARLVVYSSEGYDATVARAFRTMTGIPVTLDTGPVATLFDRIEKTRRHPGWGVLWVDGPTTAALLDSQHLLVRGQHPAVSWNNVGSHAIARDRSFVPTGVTLTAAILFTPTRVPHPPTTWSQLLKPMWKDAVGITTPTEAGSIYPFLAGMMQHAGSVTRGEQYFKDLKANGLLVGTSVGDTLHSLTSGKIQLALMQSSAAVGARRSFPNLAVAYLPPLTELPSVIAVDAKASAQERAEAERFIDFVLSPRGQRLMQVGTPDNASNFYTVLNGISPPSSLPPLRSIPTQTITPFVWGPRRASITSWFVRHITK